MSESKNRSQSLIKLGSQIRTFKVPRAGTTIAKRKTGTGDANRLESLLTNEKENLGVLKSIYTKVDGIKESFDTGH